MGQARSFASGRVAAQDLSPRVQTNGLNLRRQRIPVRSVSITNHEVLVPDVVSEVRTQNDEFRTKKTNGRASLLGSEFCVLRSDFSLDTLKSRRQRIPVRPVSITNHEVLVPDVVSESRTTNSEPRKPMDVLLFLVLNSAFCVLTSVWIRLS